MRLSGGRGCGAPRPAQPASLHARQRCCRGGTESQAHEDGSSRFGAVPHLAVAQTLEENGALDALLELQAAGKVRFVGMSGTLPHLRDHIAMGVFDVFQIPYSAIERQHETAITEAAEAGAGIVARGGAAKGAPAEGKQTGLQWERWQQARLDDLLDGRSPVEFVLRFTFTHPDMHTTIVGTVNPVHLRSNLDALAMGPLPPDVYAEAKRRLQAAGLGPQAQ
jgi:aryl-alcohol dehydrogenase-like predicted oxidoreductase